MKDAPATGHRPEWVDESLFGFTSRFIEIDGHVIHYVDEGSGPLLLMIHGNPTWSFVWAQAIERLRDSFRCVALDLPGFGLSVAADGYRFRPEEHAAVVMSFFDLLELTDATLVVQDWGGPIGLALAERRTDKIAALVVGNTWAWPVNGDLHFELFSHLLGGVVGRGLIRHFNLFVNALVPAGHRRRTITTAEMRHYRMALPTPARRTASAVFPRSITASKRFLGEVERGLPLVAELPALIVWADADIAFRDVERRRWEATLPRHTTVVLEGAGHYLQSDAPDDFARAVREWWGSWEGDTG